MTRNLHSAPLLILALLTAAFAPLIEGGTTHLPVFILNILVLAMLAVWLAGGLRRGSLAFPVMPLGPAIALFILVAIFSAFVAPYKYMALTWVRLIVYYALYFYLARAALSGNNAVRYAAAVVLCMGCFESAAGLSQWLRGAHRPSGTFFNPDMLAGYITPALLMALSLIIFKHGWVKARITKALLAALALSSVCVVILTGSRGGVLSLCAGLFAVLWVRSKRWAVAASVSLAVVILLVPNPVRNRLYEGDPFAYSRTGIWAGAARMMAEHPLGVGLGNFKYMWPRYNFPIEEAVVRYGKTASTAHSEYLHIGTEMGFAGLAVFLSGVFLLARVLVRAVKAHEEDKGVAAGLAGGVTAVFTHGLVDSNLHEPGIVFLLILLVCMALEVSKQDGATAKTVEIRPGVGKRLALLGGLLILLMAVWSAMPAAAYYYSEKAGRSVRSGDLPGALQPVDRALLLEPGNAAYHNLRASILYGMYRAGMGGKLLDEALEELKEAGRLNPNDADYPMMEARIKHEQAASVRGPDDRRALLESALGDIDRAKALNPYRADMLFERAGITLTLGDRADAAATLEGLKRLEPDFLSGRLLLARIYKDMGRNGLSRGECYSIITTYETLKAKKLSSRDREFTAVDIGETRRLLAGLEGG